MTMLPEGSGIKNDTIFEEDQVMQDSMAQVQDSGSCESDVGRPRPSQVAFRIPQQGDDEDQMQSIADVPCERTNDITKLSERTASIYSIHGVPPRSRRNLESHPSTRRAIRRLNDTTEETVATEKSENIYHVNSEYVKANRRKDTFRGKERRGDRGQAGDTKDRLKAYFQERAASFWLWLSHIASSKRKNNNFTLSVDQYFIPPPEQGSNSIFDAFGKLFFGAFDELSIWLYGASFAKVFLFDLALYFMFIYFFVFILYFVDKENRAKGEGCIGSSELGVLSTSAQLEFAFELSWTTFTSAGYGNVSPSGDRVDCYGVRVVCSIEAILGLLFVSVCSGVFYAKLLRLLGEAPVTFSSTLCIQYGKGLMHSERKHRLLSRPEEHVQGSASHVKASNDERSEFHSYPVLEFRIVNNRANLSYGNNDIWDAEVTVVVKLSLEGDSYGYNRGADKADPSCWLSSINSLSSDGTSQKNQQVYYKLSFKPSFHPYFSRVWFLQHTLDYKSPLLRREVRDALLARGKDAGWDPAWNNHRDIRASLVKFHHLRVIFNGSAELSKTDVYAVKVYSFQDVCVGWQYVGVCYDIDEKKVGLCATRCNRDQRKKSSDLVVDDKKTRVDFSLIHDIIPQKGGDFEPLDSEKILLEIPAIRNV